MKPMQAGKLRRRITVDAPVDTQDSTGAVNTTWTTKAVVWGSIEPLRGREVTGASQILPTMDTRITLRCTPAISGMNAKWRLRYQATIYDVVSVADVEMQGRALEIMCKSGQTSG